MIRQHTVRIRAPPGPGGVTPVGLRPPSVTPPWAEPLTLRYSWIDIPYPECIFLSFRWYTFSPLHGTNSLRCLHWGVFIGSPLFKADQHDNGHLTYWRDGIYGYQEGDIGK